MHHGAHSNKVIWGDALQALKSLPDSIVQTCVTSPPYLGLRDYGVDGQIGLEETPEAFTKKLVEVFREVRRVLRDDGTCWINLGDSYAGSGKGQTPNGAADPKNHKTLGMKLNGGNRYGLKPKDLIGIPWRIAFALQADGWYLRSDIIWHKPSVMPESVTDRPTRCHEYLFLLSKSQHYYYDAEAIKEPAITGGQTRKFNASKYHATDPRINCINGVRTIAPTRNKRTVWTVSAQPYTGAHFATFPPDLVEPCILAGSKRNDTVLDPFAGSGTTGSVAKKHGRQYLLIELNPHYLDLINGRLGNTPSPSP